MFKQVDRVADRVGVPTPRSWKRMVPLLALMGIILVSAAVFTSQGAGLRILLYPLPASVYEPELYVSGVAEPYQSLVAELSGSTVARTVANESGDFVMTFDLQPGINRLRVVSDEAGSTSVSDTHRIQYTPMTTGQTAGEAPAKPRFSLRSLFASVRAMVAPAAAPAAALNAPVSNVPASTALGKGERGVDEAFPLVDHPFVPQCIGQVCQDIAQHVLMAPVLKAPMHGLVVGKRRRKPVPLRAGVEDPQHRIEDRARRHRLTTRTIVRVMLLRKMFPNPIPVLIAQSPHAASVKAASGPHNSFEIGSTFL
jgi:hypothetical protein